MTNFVEEANYFDTGFDIITTATKVKATLLKKTIGTQ